MTITDPPEKWISLDLRSERPGFREIADAIERGIEAGALPPGQRLPAQRSLAADLGVALTTVSRAYTEAVNRGLLEARVGRGTRVRGGPKRLPEEEQGSGPIDLTVNSLFPQAFSTELSDILRRLSATSRATPLFDYHPPGGLQRHRDAAAAWLTSRGLAVPSDRVLITAGAQHAMAVAVSSLVPNGGALLTGVRTCYGIRNISSHHGLPLVGVEMDEEGVIPEALDAAAAETGLTCVYLMPAMQNPTGTCMSPERKAAIAAVGQNRGLWIIEDDAYGFLVDDPPLATLAPHRTVLVSSVGKVLWPGLRVGLLVPPDGPMPRRMEGAIAATIQHTAPWMGEVSCEAMETGLFTRVLGWKRTRLAERAAEVRKRLGHALTPSHPGSPHIWLQLPEPWSERDFVGAAQDRGVLVSPGDDFAVSRDLPGHAVRLCIASEERATAVLEAADRLGGLLATPPPPRTVGI